VRRVVVVDNNNAFLYHRSAMLSLDGMITVAEAASRLARRAII